MEEQIGVKDLSLWHCQICSAGPGMNLILFTQAHISGNSRVYVGLYGTDKHMSA